MAPVHCNNALTHRGYNAAMEKTFRYTCTCCGEMHQGAPSFAYNAPIHYREDAPNTELNTDFCIIDKEHFFVRTILEIPIHEYHEPFTWGVWGSLSRESFSHYMKIFEEPVREEEYFAWFSNLLPYYPDSLNLKTTVHTQPAGFRPWLELEPSDHPLSVDQRNGISWEKAIEIAQIAKHEHDA